MKPKPQVQFQRPWTMQMPAELTTQRRSAARASSTRVRARRAEAALMAGDLDAAVAALSGDLDPSDDVQASAATKKHLGGVLLRRVATQLAEARP